MTDLFKYIYLRLCEGISLRKIAEEIGRPYSTIYNWKNKSKEFDMLVKEARKIYADKLAEEIIEIADNEKRDIIDDKFNNVAVKRDKLRIEARRKIMAFFSPEAYGDLRQIASDFSLKGFSGLKIITTQKELENDRNGKMVEYKRAGHDET